MNKVSTTGLASLTTKVFTPGTFPPIAERSGFLAISNKMRAHTRPETAHKTIFLYFWTNFCFFKSATRA